MKPYKEWKSRQTVITPGYRYKDLDDIRERTKNPDIIQEKIENATFERNIDDFLGVASGVYAENSDTTISDIATIANDSVLTQELTPYVEKRQKNSLKL